MHVCMCVYHRICLDFKFCRPNRGSLVRRHEHSTIDADVENLKAPEILFRVESHVFASEEFERKRR